MSDISINIGTPICSSGNCDFVCANLFPRLDLQFVGSKTGWNMLRRKSRLRGDILFSIFFVTRLSVKLLKRWMLNGKRFPSPYREKWRAKTLLTKGREGIWLCNGSFLTQQLSWIYLEKFIKRPLQNNHAGFFFGWFAATYCIFSRCLGFLSFLSWILRFRFAQSMWKHGQKASYRDNNLVKTHQNSR